METYLALLVHLNQPLEVGMWLPGVLSQQHGLTLSSEQVLVHPDIHILNSSAETLKIEQVRTLQELSSFSPYQMPVSFFVMQNIETASIAAQNALLKILEEPPAGVCLLLSTTNPGKIVATIQSRCRLLLLAPDTSDALPEDSNLTAALYQQVISASHGELILLTESYADRAQALSVVTQLLAYIHQQLQTQSSSIHAITYVAQLQVLLQTHDWLEKNTSIKLALAECFFQLRSKKPILRP